MEAQLIPLKGLDTTAADRVRHYREQRKIDDYAAAMEDGAVFPAIRVYEDEAGKRHAWDGGYRIASHRKLEAAEILAIVEPGTFNDALAKARLANDEHGYRRTIEDKQKIARELVEEELDRRAADPDYKKLSDRELGRRANLSHTLISETAKTVKAERAAKVREAEKAAENRRIVVAHLKRLWEEGYRSLPGEYASHSFSEEELAAPEKVQGYRLESMADGIRLLLDRDQRAHPRRHDVFRVADGSIIIVLETGYTIGFRRLSGGGKLEVGRVQHNASAYDNGQNWRKVLGEKGTYEPLQVAAALPPEASKWVPPERGHDWIDGSPELGGPPPASLLPEGWDAWRAQSATTETPVEEPEADDDEQDAEDLEDTDDEASEQEAPLPGQQLLGGGEVPRRDPPHPTAKSVEATTRPTAEERRAEGRADGAWIGRVVARLRMMDDDERHDVEVLLWPEEYPDGQPVVVCVNCGVQIAHDGDGCCPTCGRALIACAHQHAADMLREALRERPVPALVAVGVQLPTTHTLLSHMVDLLDADDLDLKRRKLAVHPRVDLHRQGSTLSFDRPLDADQIRGALAEVRTWYDPSMVAPVDLALGTEVVEVVGSEDPRPPLPEPMPEVDELMARVPELLEAGLAAGFTEPLGAGEERTRLAAERKAALLAPYQPWGRPRDELSAALSAMALGELQDLMDTLGGRVVDGRQVLSRDAIEEWLGGHIEVAPAGRREQLVEEYRALSDIKFKDLYKKHKGVAPSYRQTRLRAAEILADTVLAHEEAAR